MKLVIKRSEAKVLNEQRVSKFIEYDLPFSWHSVGISEINGRYPQSGFDVDKKIQATWYVLEGRGKIYLGGEIHKVEKGDMIFVPRAEKFWIDCKSLKLLVVSSPPWSPEQHEHIEK